MRKGLKMMRKVDWNLTGGAAAIYLLYRGVSPVLLLGTGGKKAYASCTGLRLDSTLKPNIGWRQHIARINPNLSDINSMSRLRNGGVYELYSISQAPKAYSVQR